MSPPLLLILSLIFLVAMALLSGTTFALQAVGRLQAKDEFKKYTRLFFFQHIVHRRFKKHEWEGLLFCLSFTRQAFQLLYALCAFFFLLSIYPFDQALIFTEASAAVHWGWATATAAVVIMMALITDVCIRIAATARPLLYFSLSCGLASLLLLLFFPFSYLGMKGLQKLLPEAKEKGATTRIRDKILEIIHESELTPHLDPQEQKLIASVASFKERIAREIMVPRIDVFSLPSDMTIAEAAQSFLKEGYSRIPVYRDSVDHIIGVLHYKDVLNIYAQANPESSAELSNPIEKLTKPVLYTPETKKISHLLQEFRSKQIHLAIVVDEYGGTEGIVTIEDILEELVGEIADEYDTSEEVLFTALPGGGWAVDARMGINDIEKELGVRIPSSPEYDTIGGYIFHRAGAIPSKGWRLHQDDFDLEVLSSDERSIEKIKILPK